MSNEIVEQKDMKIHTFKSLLHVYGFLGTGLKVGNVALRLAEGHGALRGDHALVLLHIDLITDHDLFLLAKRDRAKRMKRERENIQKENSPDHED